MMKHYFEFKRNPEKKVSAEDQSEQQQKEQEEKSVEDENDRPIPSKVQLPMQRHEVAEVVYE